MTPPQPSREDRPAAGITAIVVGLFLFSLQDVVIKSFADSYSVLQIVFVRGVVALLLMLVAVVVTVGMRGLRSRSPGVLLLKGLFGFLSYTGYYLAIAALPLAQVVTIVFTAPIFATVLSALMLKERVGPRRWTAVLVGFIGMVVVIGPTQLGDNIAVFLALFSSLTYALSTLLTRFIAAEESPWTVSLYSMSVFLTGSAVASVLVAGFGGSFLTDDPSAQFLLRAWTLPPLFDLTLMLFLGVNAAFGFYCLAKAYLMAPVSVVAPFEYTFIVWAVLFGYFIWGEIPQATTLIGVAILVTSSLYILRRELQVGKLGETTSNLEPELEPDAPVSMEQVGLGPVPAQQPRK